MLKLKICFASGKEIVVSESGYNPDDLEKWIWENLTGASGIARSVLIRGSYLFTQHIESIVTVQGTDEL